MALAASESALAPAGSRFAVVVTPGRRSNPMPERLARQVLVDWRARRCLALMGYGTDTQDLVIGMTGGPEDRVHAALAELRRAAGVG